MAIQTINLGNRVNDGLGDDLRTAFEKVNANFAELGATLTITASNLGETGEGVFAQKVGADLQFKKLLASEGINLSSSSTSITIGNSRPIAFSRVESQDGTVIASNDSNNTITIQGGDHINTSVSGNILTVDTNINITDALTNVDFGPINGQFPFTTDLALALSNVDFGTYTSPGRINLDFGTIVGA